MKYIVSIGSGVMLAILLCILVYSIEESTLRIIGYVASIAVSCIIAWNQFLSMQDRENRNRYQD